jgi:hypothetical protein
MSQVAELFVYFVNVGACKIYIWLSLYHLAFFVEVVFDIWEWFGEGLRKAEGAQFLVNVFRQVFPKDPGAK